MKRIGQKPGTRLQSATLLLVFILVLSVLAGLIHIVFALVSQLAGYQGSLTQPSIAAIAVTLLVFFTILRGAFLRRRDVRAGGAALARRIGADPVYEQTPHAGEARLLTVVSQLAMAAATLRPDVYVLRNERSINAFILGNGNSLPAIVLTEGALDSVDKDQLQAMVAHEFAHIVNNDLPLNMHLLTLSGGLMAIDQLGRLLISKYSMISKHPGRFIGRILCLLGKPGVLAGNMAAACVCRRRKYSADAAAVELTCDAYALASALDEVGERGEKPTPGIDIVHANQLMALCFHSHQSDQRLNKIFRTHPDITHRINAIEPEYASKKREASYKQVQELAVGTIREDSEFTAIAANDDFLEHYKRERLILLLPDQSTCMAALFALFAQRGVDSGSEYLSAMGVSFHQEFIDKVQQVLRLIPDELANDQLGVIAHASSVLNEQMDVGNRQKIALKLENLLCINDNCSLMDYVRMQLIRRMLQIEFPLVSKIAGGNHSLAKARKVKNYNAMGQEFALLLSMVVEASGAHPDVLNKQFEKSLKRYTKEPYPRRTANEVGVINDLESAFQLLYVQPKSIRYAFVQHCSEIVRQSGYEIPDESSWLELFAASLRCDEFLAAA